jgi:hypothetical protein
VLNRAQNALVFCRKTVRQFFGVFQQNRPKYEAHDVFASVSFTRKLTLNIDNPAAEFDPQRTLDEIISTAENGTKPTLLGLYD